MILDAILTYQFLKRLALPFKLWPAFRMGVIDADGKLLKKRSELTPEQKAVFGIFDLMVANIKKLIGKLPGGNTTIASMAAALYLVKEENGKPVNMEEISEVVAVILETQLLVDDAPTNSAGSGQVAGMGIPPGSDPPAKRRKILYRRKKKGIWT